MNKILKSVVLVFGLVFALTALASWTPPHSSPPGCVTNPSDPNYDLGCESPVNVGSIAQTKTGSLGILGNLGVNGILTVFGGFKYPFPDLDLNGVPDVDINGKVLTSDASGNARWQTPSGGGGGGGVTSIIAGSNIMISPTTGVGDVTINSTAGGGGGGTVTNINTGAGLTGGPITTSGTISLNTAGGLNSTCTSTTNNKIIWDSVNNRLKCVTEDANTWQRRVTGICAPGSSIRAINVDGTVTCEADDSGSGGFWNGDAANIWNLNSGNVGIGITNPDYKLTVNGSIRAAGNITTSGSGGYVSASGNVTAGGDVAGGNITTSGDLSWDGELLPSGTNCAVGQVPYKIATSIWGCLTPRALTCATIQATDSVSQAGYNPAQANAVCQLGYTLMGGGAQCSSNNENGVAALVESKPETTTPPKWYAQCRFTASGAVGTITATSHAICCRLQ